MDAKTNGALSRSEIFQTLHRVYMEHEDYKVTTTLLNDMAAEIESLMIERALTPESAP